jgi:carbamoyltransferase
VRAEWAARLGAVTHVDRSARVQVVRRADNPQYWELIETFRRITGVPAVLNTSFNNNVEPIVDSVDDAVVCFLTTELDYLAIGDCLARKRGTVVKAAAFGELLVSLPQYRVLARDAAARGFLDSRSHAWFGHEPIPISNAMFELLCAADGRTSLADLLVRGPEEHSDALRSELFNLWQSRAVRLSPAD